MRHVRDEVTPNALELTQPRDIEERQYGASIREWSRCQLDGVIANVHFECLDGFTLPNGRERIAEDPIAREPIHRKGGCLSQAEQRARTRVDANDVAAFVDRDQTFVQRRAHSVKQRLVGLQRFQSQGQLLAHPMDGRGEVTDLTWCVQRRTARQVSSCNRASFIAQRLNWSHKSTRSDRDDSKGPCNRYQKTGQYAAKRHSTDCDHKHRKKGDDDQRPEDEPPGDPHARRGGAPLTRFPNPGTVSIRCLYGIACCLSAPS